MPGDDITIDAGGDVVATVAVDKGADRDTRPHRPCCARHGRGFCLLPDGHVGDHHAVGPNESPLPTDFGPRRKGKR